MIKKILSDVQTNNTASPTKVFLGNAVKPLNQIKK